MYKPATNTDILTFKAERFWNNQKLVGVPEKLPRFTMELMYDKHCDGTSKTQAPALCPCLGVPHYSLIAPH